MGVRALILATVTLLSATGGAFAEEAAMLPAASIGNFERSPAGPFTGNAAGFRPAGFAEPDRESAWRLTRTGAPYIGNRRDDLGGFGVKWQMGTTEMALTPKGMGWRWRF